MSAFHGSQRSSHPRHQVACAVLTSSTDAPLLVYISASDCELDVAAGPRRDQGSPRGQQAQQLHRGEVPRGRVVA